MLMDILMEALMSMDEESLDYVLESCDSEELEIIDEAMEASRYTYDSSAMGSELNDTMLQVGTMTEKDKKDFAFINDIQRQASSKGGWASVDKKDRDKFVDIMTKTKNLAVLKKAKKLGEREADNDTKVQRALTMIGSSVAGGAAGALIGKKSDDGVLAFITDKAFDKASKVDAKTRLAQATKIASDDAEKKYSEAFSNYSDKIVHNDINRIDDAKTIRQLSDAKYDAASALMDANYDLNVSKMDLDRINSMINNYKYPRTIGGGAVGAIAGAGLGAAINAAKKGIKNARDLKALKAQGEDMTPDQRWKAARKRAGK